MLFVFDIPPVRPLTVAIQHRNSQLSTDTQYEIICDSWGSNPAATISWFLDNVKLNTTTEVSSCICRLKERRGACEHTDRMKY